MRKTLMLALNEVKKSHCQEKIRDLLKEAKQGIWIKKTNKKLAYYNMACSFDIETSSFYQDDEKRACMYIWMLDLNDYIIIGRSWPDFIEVLNIISEEYKLDKDKRLLIYVHNLAYEFQFMRKWMNFEKVFSLDNRKPCYALTDNGIEFRCSYILSGYSLENVGKNLVKYKVEKMVGDLDYNKVRTSITPLTEKELGYCINDVRVVVSYIKEEIEKNNNNIGYIPLTKTGYVRKYVKNKCYGKYKKDKSQYMSYRNLIKALTVEPDEYLLLKKCFQGGFTHANPTKVGKVYQDAKSQDETSAYPTDMLSCLFPMSKGERYHPKDLEDVRFQFDKYCCIFEIDIVGLEPLTMHDNYLSSSKCSNLKRPVYNNGRLVSADFCTTYMTNVDFEIFERYYTYEEIKISNFWRYKKGYLPKPIIESVLDFYEAKTTLKGVEGKEAEYMQGKANLNSTFGMCVTDILQTMWLYEDDWEEPEVPDVTKAIEHYNKTPGRFLFYPWGVFITAYARRQLFEAIDVIKDDYIYSDTDSVKYTNYDKYQDFFDKYNKEVVKKCEKCLKFYDIPIERLRPKTIKGIEKPIGVWDDEGAGAFKTLGAKRYMTYKDGKVKITIAGLNPKSGANYITKVCEGNVDKCFEFFNDEMYIPPEETGKMLHTYIDEEVYGEVEDYLGEQFRYYEKSFIHLENTDYTLSISREFSDFILGIENIYL